MSWPLIIICVPFSCSYPVLFFAFCFYAPSCGRDCSPYTKPDESAVSSSANTSPCIRCTVMWFTTAPVPFTYTLVSSSCSLAFSCRVHSSPPTLPRASCLPMAGLCAPSSHSEITYLALSVVHRGSNIECRPHNPDATLSSGISTCGW